MMIAVFAQICGRNAHVKRESACFGVASGSACSSWQSCDKVQVSMKPSSRGDTDASSHRYPSPSRPVLIKDRPTPHQSPCKPATLSRRLTLCLDWMPTAATVLRTTHKQTNEQECHLRDQRYGRRLARFFWRVALRQTASARSSVQPGREVLSSSVFCSERPN